MDARIVLLLACFFLSGFAALLYQTAWTRELSFVFGTSELAVAAVLAAYMGGLALGAAAAARFATRLRRPVLAYGVLEAAIAVSALSVPAGIRLINGAYVGMLGGGGELMEGGARMAALFQLASAFAVLLPPTAFMGATLPLLARHAVRSEAEIGSRVGLLYAVNTAGAIAGTLVAAFLLMPELGLRRTVWVGAAINGLVFALAALLARGAVIPPFAPEARPSGSAPASAAAWILPALLLSGAVSFAYEVLWTRLLGHLLGGSLHAFATMLASFLLGIALGSGFAARLATSRERAAIGFGLAQLGIAFTGYAAFALADRLPALATRLGAGPDAPLASAVVAVSTLLPITLCIGATFPFAVRLLARSPEQAARATARAYSWNTVGAIVGALGAGFLLLPGLGFEGTVTVGVAVNLGLAALAAVSIRPRHLRLAAIAAAGILVLVVLPARPPWALLSSSPMSDLRPRGEVDYAAVGRSSTVLLFDQGHVFRLYTNGLPEATIERIGVLPLPRLVNLMGALPTLVRPEASELLVIGLGGGSALERIPSSIERIDVVELEPEVLVSNQRLAGRRAVDPLADPRVRVHIGDARGVLQLTEKRYDAIVSQPSHPWTAGASHLYTREFFDLVRSRLKPGGIFVQWIGIKYLDESLLRSLAATLVDAFGHVELYQPGAARGLLFAASEKPLASLAGARGMLERAPQDFAPLGLVRVEDLAAARVLGEAGMRVLADGGVPNTDDHNLLASRASRLGDGALDLATVRRVSKDEDPLLGSLDGLDRSMLIRRLTATGFKERALALALSAEGAEQETALGWVEFGLARPRRAGRHFLRALELEPESADAVAGLVTCLPWLRPQERRLARVADRALDVGLQVLLAGRRSGAAEGWDSVAALDAELERIGPGESTWEEASRLRVNWRLATRDPAAAAEAQAIVEGLLVRKWQPHDALLRARAAIAAGRPRDAWGSLIRIAQRLPERQRPAVIVGPALELADQLPEEMARALRARLQGGGTQQGVAGAQTEE